MQCNVLLRCSLPALLRCRAGPREMSATFCEPGSEERAPAAARCGPWQPGLGAAKVRLQRGLETPPTPVQQMKNVSRSLRYSRGFLSGDFHKNVHTQTLLAPPCTLQFCTQSGSVLARIDWTGRKEEIKFAVFPHLTKCSKQNRTGSDHNRWDGSCGSAKFRLIFPNSANMTNNCIKLEP